MGKICFIVQCPDLLEVTVVHTIAIFLNLFIFSFYTPTTVPLWPEAVSQEAA